MNNWGTIALSVMVLASRIQMLSCSGKLTVELKEYANPTNKLKDGFLCDPLPHADCDPFFKFTFGGETKILKPGVSGKIIKYSSQSLTFSFHTWSLSQSFSLQIWDHDAFNDDFIYGGTIELPSRANKSQSSAKAYPLTFNGKYVTVSTIVRVYCNYGYLVPDCSKYCVPRNNSKGHFHCDYKNGEKICLPGWFGVDKDCTKFCRPRSDEQGHYNCSATGEKLCLKHWYGENCTVNCIENTNQTFDCDLKTGKKICHPEWYGNFHCNKTSGMKVCNADWYGINCTNYCKEQYEASGHYSCQKESGLKICHSGWYGKNCSVFCKNKNDEFMGYYDCNRTTGLKICHKNWYGVNCTSYCKEGSVSEGRYSCNKTTGEYICHLNWFGKHCDCTETANYYCNQTTGQKICYPYWYGNNCTTYCKEKGNGTGRYFCNKTTGSNICSQNWYGIDCTVYCKGQNNASGHYSCAKRGGSKICYTGWYGENCDVFCKSTDDNSGHYSCNETSGSKICHSRWYGENCTKLCEEPVTPSSCRISKEPTMDSTTDNPKVSSTSIAKNRSSTTTKAEKSGKISEDCNRGIEWYIIVVSLISGIIIGILLIIIVVCSRRKFRGRNTPTSLADSTYQGLDLTKMNTEDNYQCLRVNAAKNDGVSDDFSTYTELSKKREVEKNYQSLN